jgi:DNA-binding beta-propeller fold protein YncE
MNGAYIVRGLIFLLAGILVACSFDTRNPPLRLNIAAECPNTKNLSVTGVKATNISYPADVVTNVDPFRLAISGQGSNNVRVSMTEGVWIEAGSIEHSAGHVDGPSATARFDTPRGIAFSKNYETLYIADSGNHVIRQWNLLDDSISTIAGQPGQFGLEDGATGQPSLMHSPSGLTLSADGNSLFITERSGRCIRRLSDLGTDNGTKATLTTYAGICGHSFDSNSGVAHDGKKLDAYFIEPRSLVRAPSTFLGHEDWLLVSDPGSNLLRLVTNQSVTTLLGEFGLPSTTGQKVTDLAAVILMDAPTGIAFHPDGWFVYADKNRQELMLACANRVRRVAAAKGTSSSLTITTIDWTAPAGVSINDLGNEKFAIYVSDADVRADDKDAKSMYIIKN